MFNNRSPYHQNARRVDTLSRREFLWRSGGGLGGIALSAMLAREGLGISPRPTGIFTGKLQHPPKAKRVIQMFMAGAASHVDMFDYKPLLAQRHG